MIWLTWRQLRLQAWVALAALAAFAAALAITGPRLRDLYAASGIAGCGADCAPLVSDFLRQAKEGGAGALYFVSIAVIFVVPALIGIFWGAPTVARELETGTHRLAWSQSVTRTRWLAVKLAGGGLVSIAALGALSIAVTWWATPLDQAGGDRLMPWVFGARGIVPFGYAAFAFAAGVTAGTLLRRTIPAMAVTLLVVAAVQLVMPFGLRGHLVTPMTYTAPFDSRAIKSLHISDDSIEVTAKVPQPGAWVVSNKTVTADGRLFTGPADPTACGRLGTDEQCGAWLDAQHLRQIAQYQPAGRFWALQWRETALFLALALALGGVSFWWVRRRLT